VAHNQPAANIQLLEHFARGKSFLSNLSPFFTWKVGEREEKKAAYSAQSVANGDLEFIFVRGEKFSKPFACNF
jgi:hypothetical protein